MLHSWYLTNMQNIFSKRIAVLNFFIKCCLKNTWGPASAKLISPLQGIVLFNDLLTASVYISISIVIQMKTVKTTTKPLKVIKTKFPSFLIQMSHVNVSEPKNCKNSTLCSTFPSSFNFYKVSNHSSSDFLFLLLLRW